MEGNIITEQAFFCCFLTSAKLNMEEYGDAFLSHLLLRRSDAYEEHGDVFFVVCPLSNCECMAPKIGMNCNQSLILLSPFDSSQFSGQTSRIYKSMPKKDIPELKIKFLS
jgi:hypothetical protein